MRLRPNLLAGLSLKKIAPAVQVPKATRKNHEKLVNTQRRKRKSVKQRWVHFEGVPVEKKGEEIRTQVSSCGRIIRRRRKS